MISMSQTSVEAICMKPATAVPQDCKPARCGRLAEISGRDVNKIFGMCGSAVIMTSVMWLGVACTALRKELLLFKLT